jgi:hypothetical protein
MVNSALASLHLSRHASQNLYGRFHKTQTMRAQGGSTKRMDETMTRLCFVFLAALVLCTCSTFGQVRIGAHVGLNLTKVLEPDENFLGEAWEMQSHILGGVVLDLELTSQLLLALQVNYTQMSFVASNGFWGLSLTGNTTFTNDYINIPIYVRWRMGEGSLRGFVECGPTVAVVVSAEARIESPGLKTTTNEVGAMYQKANFIVALGGGGELSLNTFLTLTISGHYAHGMSEIFKYHEWHGSRSSALQFDLGLLVAM